MGRQIQYYMELEMFMLVTKQALELGFTIIQGKKDFTILKSIDSVDFNQRLYLYLSLDNYPLRISNNGFIDELSCPIIEAGFSRINDQNLQISNARLWVSSGFWDNGEKYITRSDELDKKYSMLVKYIKKSTIFTEVEVRTHSGMKVKSKEYITPFCLDLVKTKQYECT